MSTYIKNFRVGFESSNYNHERLKLDDSPFMKKNADFQEGISQALSTATPLSLPSFLTTIESFEMRYYVRRFLKGHENCHGVKVESSEKRSFC